ncbi:MAG: pyruvate kinase [Acholeplasmatales bacterium]|jgi:pyruvate kinase|nr:pyruvate kinase [Acholeplasmatales bacterium]
MRKTKIICTLGPAIDDYDKLKEMVLNGLDCCRLNFSHGTHEEQLVRIERIKKLRKELGRSLPILLDTKGPEIRLRDFKNKKIELHTGDIFTLTDNFDELGDETHIGLTYPYLAKYVKPNDTILVDDGHVGLEVLAIEGANVKCKVLNDGVLSNHKSINIPNVIVDMPYLSDVDISDILFGIENDIDYVAASFVRRKQDVLDLRKLLDDNGGSEIKIIAKIENTEGVKNMDDIIETADGVMVARGDLGVEIPFKMLPGVQKDLISKCFLQGKLVVTATQMLDSMQQNPRPTRAEVSDVANAIYDRTTGIMLSGESAAGKYPIEAVSAMSEIAICTEENINYPRRFEQYNLNLGDGILSSICNSAVAASYQIGAKAIICVTIKGVTAQMLSAYRPDCPIIAVTVDPKAYQQLGLSWNVYPVKAEMKSSTDELFLYAAQKASETGLVHKGDKVIIIGGSIIGCGITDTMKIHTMK